MRKATREIHAISDALVNAKLAFGKMHKRMLGHYYHIYVHMWKL